MCSETVAYDVPGIVIITQRGEVVKDSQFYLVFLFKILDTISVYNVLIEICYFKDFSSLN